jgi:hypothetical protein
MQPYNLGRDADAYGGEAEILTLKLLAHDLPLLHEEPVFPVSNSMTMVLRIGRTHADVHRDN